MFFNIGKHSTRRQCQRILKKYIPPLAENGSSDCSVSLPPFFILIMQISVYWSFIMICLICQYFHSTLLGYTLHTKSLILRVRWVLMNIHIRVWLLQYQDKNTHRGTHIYCSNFFLGITYNSVDLIDNCNHHHNQDMEKFPHLQN